MTTTKKIPTLRGRKAGKCAMRMPGNSTAETTNLLALLARSTAVAGQFEPETSRVMAQPDAQWLAEFDGAEPLANSKQPVIVDPKPKGLACEDVVGIAVQSPPKSGILFRLWNSRVGHHPAMPEGFGADGSNRKADRVAIPTSSTSAHRLRVKTHSVVPLSRIGATKMKTAHTTPTPAQGTTHPDRTNLSFVRVEFKGPRRQRLTSWFAAPAEAYSTGCITGYRMASELSAWLQNRPSPYEAGLVLRNTLAAAFEVLKEPFTLGKPDRRGAATTYIDAMTELALMAGSVGGMHCVFVYKARRMDELALESAQLEAERNRQTGQRLAAARKARRAARLGESEVAQ